MLKKLAIISMTLILILLMKTTVFAGQESSDSAVTSGISMSPFMSVTSITYSLYFSGSTANCCIYVNPKQSGSIIDKVTVNASLMKVGSSSTVASWSKTLSIDSDGKFNFYQSKPSLSSGIYYLTATLKMYSGSTLIEEFTGNSVQVTY